MIFLNDILNTTKMSELPIQIVDLLKQVEDHIIDLGNEALEGGRDAFDDFCHMTIDNFVCRLSQQQQTEYISAYGIGKAIHLTIITYGVDTLDREEDGDIETSLLYAIIQEHLDYDSVYEKVVEMFKANLEGNHTKLLENLGKDVERETPLSILLKGLTLGHLEKMGLITF